MEEITHEEKSSKKSQMLIIVITLLILIVIGQAVALFRIHSEKKETKSMVRNTAPAVQNFNPRASQPSVPQAYLTIRQTPTTQGRAQQAQSAYDPFDAWHDDLFDEMEQMQRKMNRMMSHFAQGTFGSQMLPASSQSDFNFSPSADLEDAGDHWVARFDVPGLDKDKIEVQVQNGLLTVQGERKSERKTEDESKGYYASEIQYGSFSRSVPLPGDADESKVEASYNKGVLTVHIGKTTQSKSTAKKVAVN